jgi:hypothetical protein
MNGHTNLALYDELLDYCLQSSTAMDETINVLSPDPLQAASIAVLNESLKSASALSNDNKR